MHDLTGFQRDVLYVVAGLDEPKGLTIKDDLDALHSAPNWPARVDARLRDKRGHAVS